MTIQPTTYKGAFGNFYTDIAVKGDTAIGVDIKYRIHPFSGVGALIVRFAAHGEHVGDFKVFTPRHESTYREDKTNKSFSGVRMNKIAIPLFTPGPPIYVLKAVDAQHHVLDVVAGWIDEQLKAEGFEVLVDLKMFIHQQLFPMSNPDNFKMVLELPDLEEDGKKIKAHQKHSKADEDEDEEDPDEDEETVN